MRAPVHRLLTDHLMLVLAVVLIPVTVMPLAFRLSPFMDALFDVVNWAVILVFVLEYVLKLYVAESRSAHFRDPWHLLDLFIVLLSAAELVPFLEGRGAGAAPLLRLIRLVRFFAIAGRSVRRVDLAPAGPSSPPPVRRLQMRILEEEAEIREASQEDVAEHVASPSETWVDLQDFSEGDLDFLCEVLDVPKYVLRSKAIQESAPRIDYFKDFTTIYVWDSRLRPSAEGAVETTATRDHLLVICARDNVITISPGRTDLFERVVAEGLAMPGESFNVRVLYSIFRRKLHDYAEIIRAFEHRAAALEDAHVGSIGPDFLHTTFHLKTEINRTLRNLWHLRSVLASLRAHKVSLLHIKDENLQQLAVLHDEADYLHQTMVQVRDTLVSLIELHINKVSYDTNRVMKVLAVITSLALIPTVIGGLLGENLADSPYHVTIFEIAFLVLSLMLLALYGYWRKGWLR